MTIGEQIKERLGNFLLQIVLIVTSVRFWEIVVGATFQILKLKGIVTPEIADIITVGFAAVLGVGTFDSVATKISGIE